jgi:hypothetical protein
MPIGRPTSLRELPMITGDVDTGLLVTLTRRSLSTLRVVAPGE